LPDSFTKGKISLTGFTPKIFIEDAAPNGSAAKRKNSGKKEEASGTKSTSKTPTKVTKKPSDKSLKKVFPSSDPYFTYIG